jgi:hypothetical protein
MTVFNCDIYGTFYNGQEYNKEAIQEFVNNLNDICKILNLSDLPFRFFSTSNIKDVLNNAKVLLPYIVNTPIRITSLYSQDEHYKNGNLEKVTNENKTNQIMDKIDEDIKNHKQIERFIYADDQLMNIQIIKNYINKKYPDIEFIGLVPNMINDEEGIYSSNEKELVGVNECLSNYIADLLSIKKNNSF